MRWTSPDKPDKNRTVPNPMSVSPTQQGQRSPLEGDAPLSPSSGTTALLTVPVTASRPKQVCRPPPETTTTVDIAPCVNDLEKVHGNLPPLPSPTFSELFYLQSERPIPQFTLTPAVEEPSGIFWANETVSPPSSPNGEPQRQTQRDESFSNNLLHAPGHAARFHTAVKSFEPSLPDELQVAVGDRLEVQRRFKDGWLMGRNCTTNKRGVYPGDCIAHDVVSGSQFPHFISESSRSDSCMSGVSFVTNGSKDHYGDPQLMSDSTITIEEVEAPQTKGRMPLSTARIAALWRKSRKAVVVVTLMVVSVTLVLGLGLGLGKVYEPPAQSQAGL
ncbi:uncharacterized protein EV422DRAFT_59764 [Fimicolochytrium jonesii]|uniref:uncharacterized protein n=1 Tax=Fimicolochytrium jonesii TaxID=1396493 RepID=UPI0022FE324F|nr:uncharacterized protein EV422DRAFT_59764 [Fimicolochytrium jonesii]KAI8820692.1 hypothetical protein EV422DRAFT_59764 [Fimicolochytrium jonesii]